MEGPPNEKAFIVAQLSPTDKPLLPKRKNRVVLSKDFSKRSDGQLKKVLSDNLEEPRIVFFEEQKTYTEDEQKSC